MNFNFSKETSTGRTIVAVVYVAVVALLAAGILLGVWTAREMNAVVTDQFNAQQMVIAQTTRPGIEREMGEVKRELFSMRRPSGGGPRTAPRSGTSCSRAWCGCRNSGVRNVEVVDLGTRHAVVCAPAAGAGPSAASLKTGPTTPASSPPARSPPSGSRRC